MLAFAPQSAHLTPHSEHFPGRAAFSARRRQAHSSTQSGVFFILVFMPEKKG
jgi:hypothetical protein